MSRRAALGSIPLVGLAEPAHAAVLDGTAMAWPWALPFLGLLLTIATGPLLFPRIWHNHYGKIAAAWSGVGRLGSGGGVGTPPPAAGRGQARVPPD